VLERLLAAVADQHVLVEVGVAGMQRQLALQEPGSASHSASLFCVDSSMLMRSMPSQ
jgi:hypothetical protein